MRIEKSIVIDRPIEVVWDYATDIELFPEWNENVIEIRYLTDGPVGVGTRALDVREMMGRRVEQEMEVTTFDRPHLFEAKSLAGPFDIEVAYHFEEVGDGTRVTTVAEGTMGGLFKLASPLLKPMMGRQLEQELERLKAILEGHGGGYG